MHSPRALAVCPASPPGLPGSSTDLSSRAVHKHPGEPDDCLCPCFIAGGRLHPKGEDWPLSALPFHEAESVRLSLRLTSSPSQASPAELLHSRLLGCLLDGQFTRYHSFQNIRSARLVTTPKIAKRAPSSEKKMLLQIAFYFFPTFAALAPWREIFRRSAPPPRDAGRTVVGV